MAKQDENQRPQGAEQPAGGPGDEAGAPQAEGREPKQPKGEGKPPKGEGKPPKGEGRPPKGEGKPPKGEGEAPKGEMPSGKGEGKAAGKGEKAGGKGKGKGKPAEPEVHEPAPVPRLKILYDREVVPQLRKRFGYTNAHQIPKLEKVVLNMGVGDALQNPRFLDAAVEDMTAIAGQRPAIRRARKSIANFKLREGQAIGAMVTLRGARMYEFLDRLINVAVPRIRDFRGLPPRSFDGRGNYCFGIREQIIFPEIRYDKVEKIRGMDVVVVTTAKTDEEALELLKAMRMPLRER